MIDFLDVSFRRGNAEVLRGVTLSVARGEVVALVGRSGSGKTTLLRCVNRMLEATSGDVRVDGRSVVAWNAVDLRRHTGYVIQEVGLFPHWTVAANVATVPRLLGWTEDRVAARVDELLEASGLPPAEFRDRWPDQLSGGQRQRVGLARALAADPPVVLMDEPFAAVDPLTRAELHGQFRRLQARRQPTVLLVTHDLREAAVLADRIAVVEAGEVVACDTVAALERSPNPAVRALLDLASEGHA
ncbi:MAG: ATP-binding cassette domain-containing protein [Acidobacteria bacterium]|nr:ATP-binding cassette domain-containing protein [Acidobacteriota bacterium]